MNKGDVSRIPILALESFLLVSIQVDVDDRLALALQDDLTHRISDTGARGVLIDITSLTEVDSFLGKILSDIAAMSQVLDARTVIVGIQPAVAITLVELGLPLRGLHTALNVDKGLKLLRQITADAGEGAHGESRR